MKTHPLSIPLILFSAAALIAVSILLVYHFKITLEYLTTHEDLKSIYRDYLIHPYSLGSTYYSLENVYTRLITERVPLRPLFSPTALIHMHKYRTVTRPKTNDDFDNIQPID